MKKILGLDLGVTSIGWALITENQDHKNKEILGMGSRIVPLNTDDQNEFSRGNAISKNQKRTEKRTARKLLDRYQMRRRNLQDFLSKHNMLPDDSLKFLNSEQLYGLRVKAVKEQISLTELGRILLHLNQKRGYKSARGEENQDKKDTEYVAEVKTRHQTIRDRNETIGQYFYHGIKQNPAYIIKHQIFPREAYIEEFESILKTQSPFYPDILTSGNIEELKNKIIFYQRKLKSQKDLVNICEFEGFFTKTKEGKIIFAGPRVAPKSSPFFQVNKIWETINTINIKNKSNIPMSISSDKKKEIFDVLNISEKLTLDALYKLLGIKKDEYPPNKQLEKGLQGNLTFSKIEKILKESETDYKHLLDFEIQTEVIEKEAFLIDKETGEVLNAGPQKITTASFERTPFYQLWHVIYSIKEIEECKSALIKKFNISLDTADRLARIDFSKSGFGNRSVKAMRKTLPYLMDGHVYSVASSYAGYNHSISLTKEENIKRKLLDKLPQLAKNSLRQPIVEKILNQLINVVNSIIEQYGRPDEIRIELARELKQSREERNETFAALNKRERENDTIRKRIEEYGLRATRNNIIKYRLYQEINNQESKTNAVCIYCGKAFGISDALSGNEIDVEHIIPKSILFDDSQKNKTLSHRRCNLDKDNATAFDFMQNKSEAEFNEYIERVNDLYKRKIIGKGKRDKLLMSVKDIPKDFIERQLNETRYIARKSKELLEQICYEVNATGGGITSYLRNIWGYNEVLMNLQLPKYRELGLTEIKTIERPDKSIKEIEIIKNWSKRDDHRHHAIDALVIACTVKGYIQRINTLNATETRNSMKYDIDSIATYDSRKSLLENYFYILKPFSTKQVEEKASLILVSFKPGKRVATVTRHKAEGINKSKGVIVPRGPLSEESVYGMIYLSEPNKPLKYLFEHPQLIYKPKIKTLVLERLEKFENDQKKALASLKKEPIFLDNEQKTQLEYGTCFRKEYVIKYPVSTLKIKDTEAIIDKKVKEIVRARLALFNNNEKEAFRDLDKNPIWFNESKQIPIKTVRCLTGLSAVEPVKKDIGGKDIGFVKSGNNHHIAFYTDSNGVQHEHICSFWHAVERKKHGLPVVISNPKEVWSSILENKGEHANSFFEKLPMDTWMFNFSLQQNEMFVLGLSKEVAEKAVQESDHKLLSGHIYRVQKLTSSDYWFRHHLETQIIDSQESKISKRFYRAQSLNAINNLSPKKISINKLGNIVIEK
jgi:CRISPR-associated endonuclease Csn1